MRHPRDARTAYYIDPEDLLAIGRREGEGYRVATIYHSHIDIGAYFSPTDRQNALINGEPAYPDAVYVVRLGARAPGRSTRPRSPGTPSRAISSRTALPEG